MMTRRGRRAAALAAGAVMAAVMVAGGYALLHAGRTASPPAADRARTGGSPSPAAAAVAAGTPAQRIPLVVPNSVRARRAVTLTDCAVTRSGGHASGTVTAPGASAATYTITVFFTTRQATVIGYGTTKVHAAPGKATPWQAGGRFTASHGMRCVLRGVTTS